MKLGGSVLTDKSRYRVARGDVIARLANEVGAVDEPVVLVHGAGSFGHVLAKRHGVVGGADGSREQAVGFARVHADVRALAGHVLDALHEAGLAAVWVSPFDVARVAGGRLESFDVDAVRAALERGLLPVTGGDAVLDAERGFGVLSGDVLVESLAASLRPSRVVFVTDVDGVFDGMPGEAGASLLTHVDASVAAGDAAGVDDVTGGMGGKLAAARRIAATGVPVQVVNGLVQDRVRDALAGRPVIGTVVEA